MCSERTQLPNSLSASRRPTGTTAFRLVLAALGLVVMVGCGKMGDPMPPLRNVPMKTSDLSIHQQGNVIFFDMAFPNTTASGMALGGIDGVELSQYAKTLQADGSLPTVDPREFGPASEVLLTLRGSDLSAAVVGDRIQFRLPLSDDLPEEPTSASYYAVKTFKGDEASALSNQVALIPAKPPEAPKSLGLEGQARSVQVTWELDDPRPVEGFEILRRDAREKGYGAPLDRVPGDAREFSDRSATYGNRYIYTVRSIASTNPLVLSADSGEREIEYEDRFPPATPRNFVALAETGAVRLRWDPSPDSDVAGYILFRREPGRDFHPLNDSPMRQVEYLDRGLTSGFSYSYRIRVVDQKGNESPLSDPITTAVR